MEQHTTIREYPKILLADKLETVLSRNIANTRPRDFYDIYILSTLHCSQYDPMVLRSALEETAKKRGIFSVIPKYSSIIDNIQKDPGMQNFWKNYQKAFDYANDVSFEEICTTLRKTMSDIYSDM